MTNKNKEVNEILKDLESGLKECFVSDNYKSYLKAMSCLHQYSPNNIMLIMKQMPTASMVAGYTTWKNMFKRSVRRGEHGIKIIMPAPVTISKENQVIDEDGIVRNVITRVTIPKFKVGYVYDISQTEGSDVPTLKTGDLNSDVNRFEEIMDAVAAVTPATVFIQDGDIGVKGYYSTRDKKIVIQAGMSQLHTLKTFIHEAAHSVLHDRDAMKNKGEFVDANTREIEAESVAFTVCSYLGLDTSDYSFPYIAAWSESHDISDLRASLDTIREASADFINAIEDKIRPHAIERESVKDFCRNTNKYERGAR